MRIATPQAAVAVGGVVHGPSTVFDGAAFDSRELRSGQLFVALVADRDGHDFIEDAVLAGAAAVLVSDVSRVPLSVSAIVVDDTAAALMRLAGWARGLLDGAVVGITGSVGKTTTKDLIAAALGANRRVAANERSYNNEQGLPVTVLNAPDDVDVLVVEMGMRGFGEIGRLAQVAAPTVGVVTRVAASHTGRLGGLEGVALAKRELIESLPASGTAVLNIDDERVAAMAAHTESALVTYGTQASADVMIRGLVLDEHARPSATVDTPWGAVELSLAVPGAHMASNAAAALAVAGVVTGRVDAAAEALSVASVSAGRMQTMTSPSGALVINDAYNANPDSAAAAIAALAALPLGRKIAVLGPMAELADPVGGHRLVADQVRSAGIELVAVDTELYGVPAVGDVDEAVAALGEIDRDTAVLVKASNSARLWRVAEALVAD